MNVTGVVRVVVVVVVVVESLEKRKFWIFPKGPEKKSNENDYSPVN